MFSQYNETPARNRKSPKSARKGSSINNQAFPTPSRMPIIRAPSKSSTLQASLLRSPDKKTIFFMVKTPNNQKNTISTELAVSSYEKILMSVKSQVRKTEGLLFYKKNRLLSPTDRVDIRKQLGDLNTIEKLVIQKLCNELQVLKDRAKNLSKTNGEYAARLFELESSEKQSVEEKLSSLVSAQLVAVALLEAQLELVKEQAEKAVSEMSSKFPEFQQQLLKEFESRESASIVGDLADTLSIGEQLNVIQQERDALATQLASVEASAEERAQEAQRKLGEKVSIDKCFMLAAGICEVYGETTMYNEFKRCFDENPQFDVGSFDFKGLSISHPVRNALLFAVLLAAPLFGVCAALSCGVLIPPIAIIAQHLLLLEIVLGTGAMLSTFKAATLFSESNNPQKALLNADFNARKERLAANR